MSKAVSDYVDQACKAKMLATFNDEVQDMPTYRYIVACNRFIRRVCAYIRKENADVSDCSGLETNYGESENVIFAREEIKLLFIQRMKEIIDKNEELLTNFLLHYNPNDLPSDVQSGGDPTDDLLKASQQAEEATKQAQEQAEEAKKQAEEQVEEAKKQAEEQAEEAKKQLEEQTNALGIPPAILNNTESYKTSLNPEDEDNENKIKNNEKLQEPIARPKKLYRSEAEEIVLFLTDYMGDFIKCNKNSHEEIRKLLDLVFKISMEEFVKKGEEKNNLLSIFENQSKLITSKANEEKISILENNLNDLNDIISNTEDVVCKIKTSQKYMHIIDKLYTAYVQKSFVDLTSIDIESEIEKKLNELPTFDKHKKILFNGGEYKYKIYTPSDKKNEEDTDITTPNLDEKEENDNLIEKTIKLNEFSKTKGSFIIQSDYYELLNRLINPPEDNEDEKPEENEEEKEESPTTLIDALQGADMKEGGKKKTKVNRRKNKFNHTKKAKK